MAANVAKHVLVVAGAPPATLISAAGLTSRVQVRVTGGATARLFAKNGYSVALIARGADSLTKISDEINAEGGQAAPFPLKSYSYEDIATTWSAIQKRFPKPEYEIRAAVWNVANAVFKPFLDITYDELDATVDTEIKSAFAFARHSILAFKENEIDPVNGKRGALIFTGATASIRGNILTSAISAGKNGSRALSQSLAKEFGKDNIHVSHAIIDGVILTDRTRDYKKDPGWAENENVRLNPEGIAKSYLYLVNQDRSSWTWELDLRPAHEKW